MTTMRNESHCRGFKDLDLGSCLLHLVRVRFGFLTLDKGGIVKTCPICRCFLLTCINLISFDLFSGSNSIAISRVGFQYKNKK
jgi:hypothetical protein